MMNFTVNPDLIQNLTPDLETAFDETTSQQIWFKNVLLREGSWFQRVLVTEGSCSLLLI